MIMQKAKSILKKQMPRLKNLELIKNESKTAMIYALFTLMKYQNKKISR